MAEKALLAFQGGTVKASEQTTLVCHCPESHFLSDNVEAHFSIVKPLTCVKQKSVHRQVTQEISMQQNHHIDCFQEIAKVSKQPKNQRNRPVTLHNIQLITNPNIWSPKIHTFKIGAQVMNLFNPIGIQKLCNKGTCRSTRQAI